MAAAPPRACARPAERSSSAATASSGPLAACARCHARRSGSSCGSVASASARWRAPGLGREGLQPAHETLLDAAGHRHLLGEPESARHRDRLSARQLEQRKRIAARLGQDPVTYSLVERPRDRRVEQQPGVIGGQPLDHELRQPLELVLVAGFAQPEHQSHALRQEPPRHERERLRGHPVEPLRVVDDAYERLLLGRVGQQAQDRQSHEEAIRRRSGAEAERRAQRVALRAR